MKQIEYHIKSSKLTSEYEEKVPYLRLAMK